MNQIVRWGLSLLRNTWKPIKADKQGNFVLVPQSDIIPVHRAILNSGDYTIVDSFDRADLWMNYQQLVKRVAKFSDDPAHCMSRLFGAWRGHTHITAKLQITCKTTKTAWVSVVP